MMYCSNIGHFKVALYGNGTSKSAIKKVIAPSAVRHECYYDVIEHECLIICDYNFLIFCFSIFCNLSVF